MYISKGLLERVFRVGTSKEHYKGVDHAMWLTGWPYA